MSSELSINTDVDLEGRISLSRVTAPAVGRAVDFGVPRRPYMQVFFVSKPWRAAVTLEGSDDGTEWRTLGFRLWDPEYEWIGDGTNTITDAVVAAYADGQVRYARANLISLEHDGNVASAVSCVVSALP